MNKTITINRVTATLATLSAINRRHKNPSVSFNAKSHYTILKLGFELYLDSSNNMLSLQSINNMIDESKTFIQTVREEKSHAR